MEEEVYTKLNNYVAGYYKNLQISSDDIVDYIKIIDGTEGLKSSKILEAKVSLTRIINFEDNALCRRYQVS